jgi:hypothetical protein
MIVAYDTRGFPCTVVVLPQDNKFRFTDRLSVVMPWMSEEMSAHFNCAVAFQMMSLQRARNEFAPNLSANVVFYRLNFGVSSEAQSP